MKSMGHTLYDMYAAQQLKLNNCKEPEWAELAPEDRDAWEHTALEFRDTFIS